MPGFRGRIVKSKEEGKFEVAGIISHLGDNKAEITELPVKRWTQDYREFLEEHLPKGERKKEGNKLLEDYQEYHSEKTVHFELSLSAEGNDSALDILREFADVRLSIYETRKAYLLARLTRECEVLSAKARFVKMVIEGRIVIRKRKIDLRKNGFKALWELKGESAAETEEKGEDEEADEDDGSGEDILKALDILDSLGHLKNFIFAGGDFEYLVGMPISTLTAEKVAKLMQEQEKKAQELQTLKRKKPSDLWLEDLEVLETALDERDAAALQEEETEQAKIQKAKSKASAGRRSVKRSASGPPAPKSEVKPKAAKESRSQSVGRRGMKRNASGPLEAA
eukprot:s2321_g2.t1